MGLVYSSHNISTEEVFLDATLYAAGDAVAFSRLQATSGATVSLKPLTALASYTTPAASAVAVLEPLESSATSTTTGVASSSGVLQPLSSFGFSGGQASLAFSLTALEPLESSAYSTVIVPPTGASAASATSLLGLFMVEPPPSEFIVPTSGSSETLMEPLISAGSEQASAQAITTLRPLISSGKYGAISVQAVEQVWFFDSHSQAAHYSLFDRVIYNVNMLVRRELTLALTDVLTLTHRAESTLELVASDVVALLDTLYHTLGIPVSDALSMEGMCDSTALLASSLTEVMDYADRLGLTRQLSASETLELAGTITVGSVLARLAESYGLVGSAATTFTNYIALIADLDLSAEATDRLRLNLAAVITLVDTTRLATNYLLALSDELTLADSVSNTATFGLVATEDMTFIDALSAMLSGQSALSSVFGLIGTVLIPVGNERITWVVNAHTQAAYTFTNYDFNSFAQVGAFAYGCKSDGVYQLSGADDAGEAIPTPTLLTGMTDFDTAHLKSIPTLYLGYNSIGETLLKVRVSEAGKGEEFWYRLTEYPATEPRAARLQIGRGLKSRYWQFKIEAVDGVPAEYDSLELMPLVLQRRIR